MASLAIYRGDQFERRMELGDGVIRIGRAPENELVLEDANKGVSRAHAEIRQDQGRYMIVDLNSQNGVWLGDRRVSYDPLPMDVPVRIGPYRLVIESTQPVPVDPEADRVAPETRFHEETDIAEPTQMAQGTAQVGGTIPVLPPVPAPRRRSPVAAVAAIAVVLAGLGAWAAVALLRGPAPVVGTTAGDLERRQQLEAEQERARQRTEQEELEKARLAQEQARTAFDAQLAKAQASYDARDKAAAATEVEAAIQILPADPRGATLRDLIAGLPDNAVAPGPPALVDCQMGPRALEHSPAQGEVGIRELIPVSRCESVRSVGRLVCSERSGPEMPGEIWIRASGLWEQGDYSGAIRALTDALSSSNLQSYGHQPGQARDIIAKAQAQLDRIADETAIRRRVQELIDAAGKTGPIDVALVTQLRSARGSAAPPGLTDALASLEARARKEVSEVLSEANGYFFKNRSAQAVGRLERAIELMALFPSDFKEERESARERLTTLRPKQAP